MEGRLSFVVCERENRRRRGGKGRRRMGREVAEEDGNGLKRNKRRGKIMGWAVLAWEKNEGKEKKREKIRRKRGRRRRENGERREC